jgi:hypothetical protein
LTRFHQRSVAIISIAAGARITWARGRFDS